MTFVEPVRAIDRGWRWISACVQLARKKEKSSHLLVEAQLVIQDDAVGLLRLRPRQGEAVHGGADLVHDGNDGGSCRVKREQ